MNKSAETILSEALVGKIVKSLQYSADNPPSERVPIIGKKIVKVRFGFNDCREDAGLLLYCESVDDPVFVYCNENIVTE